ncbi:MAG: hypothetical protein B7X46_14075 [Thiomonas sp. 15-66-11]|nr:MAG: hypothetical protein B7X46_14075 [Thiomonas sp. 15-66-11]
MECTRPEFAMEFVDLLHGQWTFLRQGKHSRAEGLSSLVCIFCCFRFLMVGRHRSQKFMRIRVLQNLPTLLRQCANHGPANRETVVPPTIVLHRGGK